MVVDAQEGRPRNIPFELQPVTEEEKLRLEVRNLGGKPAVGCSRPAVAGSSKSAQPLCMGYVSAWPCQRLSQQLSLVSLVGVLCSGPLLLLVRVVGRIMLLLMRFPCVSCRVRVRGGHSAS